MNGIFLQGNSYDSVFRYERHLVFPKMMKNNCPDFSVDQSFYNADEEKEGTCRRYLSLLDNALNQVLSNSVCIFFRNLCVEIGEKTNVYTLEVSMHGHELSNDDPAEENEVLPYSEEECKFIR